MAFYRLVPEGAGGHLITIEAQLNLADLTKGDTLDIRLLGLPQTALEARDRPLAKCIEQGRRAAAQERLCYRSASGGAFLRVYTWEIPCCT